RAAWSLVSLARALERFPKIEGAFRDGEITALEAAALCRAACGDTQDDWLARARTSTLQQLREDIDFVTATGDASGLPPARPRPAACTAAAVRPAEAAWEGARDAMSAPDRRRREHGAPHGTSSVTCAPRTSGTTATTAAQRADVWHAMLGEDPASVAREML